MTFTNRILHQLNKNSFGRGILKRVIYLRYKQRGKDINAVRYLQEFKAWEIEINDSTYLSSGPGWAYDNDFLSEQLKTLSCNQYLPKEGDIVIDVGAGVGEEAIILSKLVGVQGRVFAIEAHPRTFGALSYMVTKNNLNNVSCFNVAFSDRPGIVEIDDTDNSLANSILPTGGHKALRVMGQTFDEFVLENNIVRIDLVKMNVEGAEQLIIKGMIKSLPLIKQLAISCHDFRFNRGQSEFFKTKGIVVDFLRDKGFSINTQRTNVAMLEDYVYAENLAFLRNWDD